MTEKAITAGDVTPLRVPEEAPEGAVVAGGGVGGGVGAGVGEGLGAGSTAQSKITNTPDGPKNCEHCLIGAAGGISRLHELGSGDDVYAADVSHDVALKKYSLPETIGPKPQTHVWLVKINGLGADKKVLDMFWQLLSVKAVILMVIRGG